MKTVLKQSTDSMPIPSKIPMAPFFANVQTQPKIHIKFQGIPSSQNNLGKTDLKYSYLPIKKLPTKLQVIKSVVLHRDRHINQ